MSGPKGARPDPPDGFQPLSLDHKDMVDAYLRRDPPRTSELTFTNLFMWRHAYHPYVQDQGDLLLILCAPPAEPPYALPPVGPGDKAAALDRLAGHLAEAGAETLVARADQTLLDLAAEAGWVGEPTPEHGDYVYRTDDLIRLAGRKYHGPKNHVNQFEKKHDFELVRLKPDLAEFLLHLEETWCRLKSCDQDPDMAGEDRAVHEALRHMADLDYFGLAVVIEGRVEAFTFGETLNPDTAVVHAEKANPQYKGLAATVNQRFCQKMLADYTFVNREQDLGRENLRRTKQRYHPDHLVDKYRILMPSVP
jgi:hypothetical protein